MSTDFLQGLLGQNTGTPAGWNGYLYHEAMQQKQGADRIVVPPCKPNEAQWHSTGECFVPTQFHVNIAVTSVALNIFLLLVFAFFILRSRKS